MQVNFGDNLTLDAKSAAGIVNAIGELTEGKKALILNIAGKQTSANPDARQFSASAEGNRFTIADAFVVNGLAQKLIANFYINFHKPIVTTKIFNDVNLATEWLKNQL